MGLTDEIVNSITIRAQRELDTLPYTHIMHSLLQGYPTHGHIPVTYGITDSRKNLLQREISEIEELHKTVNAQQSRRNLLQFTYDEFRRRYLKGYWGWKGQDVLSDIIELTTYEQRAASACVIEGCLYYKKTNGVAPAGMSEDDLKEKMFQITGAYHHDLPTTICTDYSLLGLLMYEVERRKKIALDAGAGHDSVFMTLTDYASRNGINISYPLSLRFPNPRGGGGPLHDPLERPPPMDER